MVDGTVLKLGDGKEYVIAPISIGAIKRFGERISQFSTMTLEEQINLSIDLLQASLKRNYPEITKEYIEDELLHMGNIFDIMVTITNASGFVKADGKGEEQAGGK